jgi:hypothetical protein
LYRGELNDDKPDGIGVLYKLIEWNDVKYSIILYIGEFKDGKYDGYGMKYYEPSDENLYSFSDIYNDNFKEHLKKN